MNNTTTNENISFGLNGRPVTLEHNPNLTLLNAVRGLGWCGTKEGCAEGDCGACTVALLEPSGQYRAVNSCLMLAAQAAGLEVWTSEGIGKPEAMHVVQKEMAARGGSQCGYCTPGFVMSMFCEYQSNQSQPDEHALVGNLCRCTGYKPIREAMQALKFMENDFSVHAKKANVSRAAIALPNFFRPDSLQTALEYLGNNPETRMIAGGTDITLELTTAFKPLGKLLSLECIPELHMLQQTNTHFEIGAGLTLSCLEQELHNKIPLLKQLWPWFASKQIRNRATLGGNIATASPIGDATPVLLALDASLILVSSNGTREILLTDFFLSYRKTAMQPSEMIQSIRIPHRANKGRENKNRFEKVYKIAKRGHDDISSVMAAFVLEKNDAGNVEYLRLAYGGVAATPTRALKTEIFLQGKKWNAENIKNAKEILGTEFMPISDFRASKEYRAKIIVNLLEKFFYDSESTNP